MRAIPVIEDDRFSESLDLPNLPETVVAYCDSTIAFPLFCEYVIGSESSRRVRKELVHRRGELVVELERQAQERRTSR